MELSDASVGMRIFDKSVYADLSPHMQTYMYLSLRNDACVYIYMSAYYADFACGLMYVGSGNNFVTFGVPYVRPQCHTLLVLIRKYALDYYCTHAVHCVGLRSYMYVDSIHTLHKLYLGYCTNKHDIASKLHVPSFLSCLGFSALLLCCPLSKLKSAIS